MNKLSSNGISNRGKLAEEKLFELTGFSEPEVEVKDVDQGNTGATTINQVRTIDWVPLCIYHHPFDQWYVLPPERVYNLTKNRKGQHSANSIENCTLSLTKNGSFDQFKVVESELRERIRQILNDSQAAKEDLGIAFNQYLKDQHLAQQKLQEHIARIGVGLPSRKDS